MNGKVEEDDQAVIEVPAASAKLSSPSVASRPHWITIIHQLLSPLVSLAAVGIAVYGYNLSQKSLAATQQGIRVGQRAYVSIPRGTIATTLDKINTMPEPEANFRVFTEVENLGNTPATLTSLLFLITYRVDGPPVRYETLHKSAETMLGELGQKGRRAFSYRFLVPTTERTRLKLPRLSEVFGQEFGTGSNYAIIGLLRYRDVFNDEHYTSWFWHPQLSPPEWPDQCSGVEALEATKIALQSELPKTQ